MLTGNGLSLSTSNINREEFSRVVEFFKVFQQTCCDALMEHETRGAFVADSWTHAGGGGGNTRVMEGGDCFERGGVNFSHVTGKTLPPSASAGRPGVAGKPFSASGVSVVLHPQNPMLPTCHMNLRIFAADMESDAPVWWFGGGYDLTPYYGFDEDCIHWHKTAKAACDKFSRHLYPQFKQQCDEYFYLKHRREPRGIGGVFFDDFNEFGFSRSFELVQAVGHSFLHAYLPIVMRRKNAEFSARQREFQLHRRGRYVEFNLLFDRGTLFGLQSGGRTESIFMSMPPMVAWHYNHQYDKGSSEDKLLNYYLVPRNWAAMDGSCTYRGP